MKMFLIEEGYTALRVYEVEAKSEKQAREIYGEGTPVDDSEFQAELKTITAVKKHEDGSYSKEEI